MTFILSVLLPVIAPSLRTAPAVVLYLVLVITAGIYALAVSFSLLKSVDDRKRGIRAFTALSLYRLAISAAILLTVLVAGIQQ